MRLVWSIFLIIGIAVAIARHAFPAHVTALALADAVLAVLLWPLALAGHPVAPPQT